MKRLLTSLFGLILFIVLTGCSININAHQELNPSKTRVTKKYQVSDFASIESNVPAYIVFTQSPVCKVEAEGPENYIEHLRISTKDNKLTLRIEPENVRFRSSRKAKVTIQVSAPMLEDIIHEGVGNILLKDIVQVKDLNIDCSSVGNIQADSLICNRLEITTNGVGNIQLCGMANTARYQSDGVGSIRAKDLKAEEVEVSMNGVGNISCYASKRLTANSSGVGSIDYYGHPEEKDLNKSGIGSINEK